MKKFLKVMKALSDPNRIKIIKMLEQRTLCVCELQAALGISQSTVSKHLKILEEAGLVTFKKDGSWVNYHLNVDSKNIYSSKMLEILRNWLNEDEEIDKLIKNLKNISRENILRKL